MTPLPSFAEKKKDERHQLQKTCVPRILSVWEKAKSSQNFRPQGEGSLHPFLWRAGFPEVDFCFLAVTHGCLLSPLLQKGYFLFRKCPAFPRFRKDALSITHDPVNWSNLPVQGGSHLILIQQTQEFSGLKLEEACNIFWFLEIEFRNLFCDTGSQMQQCDWNLVLLRKKLETWIQSKKVHNTVSTWVLVSHLKKLNLCFICSIRCPYFWMPV